jgi:hypothetical protein
MTVAQSGVAPNGEFTRNRAEDIDRIVSWDHALTKYRR